MTQTDPANRVIVECELTEPPEKVWKALTVPELLAKWLLPNDIRPEVGAHFRLLPRKDGAGSIECQVLEAERNRRLRLSWREVDDESGADVHCRIVRSIVTFELSETAVGGTYLRLVHEGFEVVAIAAVSARVIQLPRSQRRGIRRMRRPVNAMSRPAHLRRAA